jgi:hypothetical protein
LHGERIEIVTEWVEDTSSKECRYDQHAVDPRCAGCPQPKV